MEKLGSIGTNSTICLLINDPLFFCKNEFKTFLNKEMNRTE